MTNKVPSRQCLQSPCSPNEDWRGLHLRTDSALLDDSSDDAIQMQIPHSIQCIKARSHAGAILLQSTQDTLSQIFPDMPLVCVSFLRVPWTMMELLLDIV